MNFYAVGVKITSRHISAHISAHSCCYIFNEDIERHQREQKIFHAFRIFISIFFFAFFFALSVRIWITNNVTWYDAIENDAKEILSMEEIHSTWKTISFTICLKRMCCDELTFLLPVGRDVDSIAISSGKWCWCCWDFFCNIKFMSIDSRVDD